jgi:hypothetical protein
MQLRHPNLPMLNIAPPLTLWDYCFQHHLPVMLYRLPDLRTNMFDRYVDTFEASLSTVLVRHWSLADEKTRQQRSHDSVTIQYTAHNGSYTSLVIIEPNAGLFHAALMRLHHGVWTSRQNCTGRLNWRSDRLNPKIRVAVQSPLQYPK